MLSKRSFLLANIAVLLGAIAGVSAASAAQITPAAVLNARSPEFTGVSITPPSITPVSISLKHFTPTSISLDLPTPTCTQTITPDKNGYVPPGTCNALYNYYPSFGAAIAMSIIFGIVSMAHITQAAIYKKGFCWVVIMGALWECGGYVSRSISTRHQQSSGLATISQLLVLLAPLWVNAFDYMLLARMIYFFIPSKRLFGLRPAFLTIIFVSLDFTSFVIQLVGGGMAGPGQPHDAVMRGIHIYMGGIGLQEFFIVVFLGLAIKFHLEMIKVERTGALMGTPKAKWRWTVYPLYISLTFITIRIIYRLAEFSAGNDPSNPLPYHEVYAYVFDSAPMLCAILIWNISHPGRFIHGPDSVMPRSGIGKYLCCCCRGRNNKNKELNKTASNDSEYYALTDNTYNPTQNHPGHYGYVGGRNDERSNQNFAYPNDGAGVQNRV